MVSNIYVNLPVQNLQKSMDFFKAMGFSFNPKFTDETAACLVLGENIFAMLITKERFKDFTKKEISDAQQSTEVLMAIEVASKDKVNELVDTAVEEGGEIYREPDDYGWMYARSFADLDGHQWEIMWSDESKMEAAES